MKDMFYNYDHKVILPTDPYVGTHYIDLNKPEKPESCNCAKILRNVKGKPIGIEAKDNSVFKLYFSLDTLFDDGSLYPVLSDAIFNFKVFDRQHKVLLSKTVDLDPVSDAASEAETDEPASEYANIGIIFDDKIVCVELNATGDSPLKYGLYTMQLDTTLAGGKTYTLFSERDGKLSIS